MGHLVAGVHRVLGPEPHHHGLGPDRQGPHELVVVDRGLQVHQHLARGVVGPVQVVVVVDPRHPTPAAAVERLHVEREPELVGDGVEVERPVVACGGVGPARVVDRVLVGHQDGPRDLEPEPDHRAVGAVLLHRLERERRVQQVGAVDQGGLLEPLAGVVVPVRQAVDDEVGAHRVTQVEGLDRQSFGAEVVTGAVLGTDHPEPAHDGLEGRGQSSSAPSNSPTRWFVVPLMPASSHWPAARPRAVPQPTTGPRWRSATGSDWGRGSPATRSSCACRDARSSVHSIPRTAVTRPSPGCSASSPRSSRRHRHPGGGRSRSAAVAHASTKSQIRSKCTKSASCGSVALVKKDPDCANTAAKLPGWTTRHGRRPVRPG